MSKLHFLRNALLASLCLLFVSSATGQVQEKVLHTFEGPDGSRPDGNLMFDPAGNIYGTTEEGGAAGNGTVYEFSPTRSGWNFSILYSFSGGEDGGTPAAGLVIDGSGNLYGTTAGGGTYGLGTVFELAPSLQGGWNETVLYSFGGYQGDGVQVQSGLIFDAAGNLYGTTDEGGSTNCTGGCGTVYELAPSGNGQWSESVLYRFLGGDDGYYPIGSGLVFDGQGNLFGTTGLGGSSGCHRTGCGTVFELTPSQGGGWTEKIIHAFNGRDGLSPETGVIIDSLGNLYGTAFEGGIVPCNTSSAGCGTVFRLSPDGSGGWSLIVLHKFAGGPGDGANPVGSLVLDDSSRLYGTTFAGGAGDVGSVFQLRRSGKKVVETIYGGFGRAAGADLYAGVIIDNAGNVYGTTYQSDPGDGLVFELTK